MALVEILDLYPTLAALAGLPDPLENGEDINGTSMVPLFEDPSTTIKNAAFSQFAKVNTTSVFNKFKRNQTALMGYSIRTEVWRYTCWFKFDDIRLVPLVDNILGRELYEHEHDTGLWLEYPGENVNLVEEPKFEGVVDNLHSQVLDYIQLRPV